MECRGGARRFSTVFVQCPMLSIIKTFSIMIESDLMDKAGDKIADVYDKAEKGVVSGYKKVEDKVSSAYKKVEDKAKDILADKKDEKHE